MSGFAYRAGGPLAFLLMAPLAAAGLGLAGSPRAGRRVTPDTGSINRDVDITDRGAERCLGSRSEVFC